MSEEASQAAGRAEQSGDQAAANTECMRGEQTLDEVLRSLASIKPMIDVSAIRFQVRRVIHFVVQHNHDVLDGRHMDQVVLSGLYGICKIHQADVTFKDLVEAYKRMPSASKETWLEVPLLEQGKTGNIIAFYNEVFVPRCKDYLHGMKDATIPGMPLPYARYAVAENNGIVVPATAAGQPIPPGTLTNSPAGFRQSKRARTDERKASSEGGGSAGGSDDAEMPPPHSPTRKPREPVLRSPFAEYPASPYKRKAVVSPMRAPAASPVRRQVLAGGRGPTAHASPVRTSHGAAMRGSQTPRTAFLHSFGTLGASPAPSGAQPFDGINDRLRGAAADDAEGAPHVPRVASRPIGYGASRAGASGLDAIANGSDLDEGSIVAPPRTLSNAGSSALLALAQVSDYKRLQAAASDATGTEAGGAAAAGAPQDVAVSARAHTAEPAAAASFVSPAPPSSSAAPEPSEQTAPPGAGAEGGAAMQDLATASLVAAGGDAVAQAD